MAQRKIAVLLYGIASASCFIAAAIHGRTGNWGNLTLLACGVVFAILAVAMRAKAPLRGRTHR